MRIRFNGKEKLVKREENLWEFRQRKALKFSFSCLEYHSERSFFFSVTANREIKKNLADFSKNLTISTISSNTYVK